ncbi:related to cell cycle regulation Mob3 [Phialocephala subalpina]|uniref:Related to cell cycle regulation Mob3 n=1 Tax=Phialocephala subalpina TaxID=576137 RepID=A0A1L7XBK8_9HELO|nr:related to cell cycle regulation Mob3 [Phialocephala subalpina]
MSLPPSSPRLPSPPPPTEIQIGPKSPSLSGANTEPTMEQSIIDANAKRRIHPGTKSADMAAGPPLIPLNELDSAFQLQEHLKALHYHYSKPPSSTPNAVITSTIAITRETAKLIATKPEGVDRSLWLYELCRFLINKCNDLIIGFLFDDPPCSATTCPEMRASEWQFLCAVHESPKSCCAIDYCCHTLDWATNIVTSQKIFPSRLSLGAGDAVDERGAGVKHLTNIFRRLHRIFAHAWFQHRGVFWQVEGQTGLYVLFKMVCDSYDLLPAENYKLPPEAEGLEPAEEAKLMVPSIMKSIPAGNHAGTEEDFISVGRTNTRRHIRQSPSVGSAVTTVLESDEEEAAADVAKKLNAMSIAEEEGEAEVTVIVEEYEVNDHPESEEPKQELEESREAEQEAPQQVGSIGSSWDNMSELDIEEPVAPKEHTDLSVEKGEENVEDLESFDPETKAPVPKETSREETKEEDEAENKEQEES